MTPDHRPPRGWLRVEGLEASRPWPTLSPASAALVALAWTAALAIIAVFAHPTPLYLVETDLVGEYLPAARELASGLLNLTHYSYKGPGYPLLVALLSGPLHGDVFLAARLLSPLAAGFAAWLAYLLARRTVGEAIATFVMLAMLASPTLARYALESGTDTPALALMLGSTLLVMLEVPVGLCLAAGLLAGIAMLTRNNAVFLVPCAALVLLASKRRVRSLAAYAAGIAVPLAVWKWTAAQHGGLPADRNYINVAWELYGRGISHDLFETTAGARFHSLWGVMAYDPRRALEHIASNLVIQRGLDLRDLVTIPPGLLAVPGVVILTRMPRALTWLLHGLACAMILATVSYNPRFGLYLLPIYLTATGTLLAWVAVRVGAAATAPARLARPAATAVGAFLVLALGSTAYGQARRSLADAPHETRLAGEALARMGISGAKIVARKPHVAYFARMQYVPLPLDQPLAKLASWARGQGADYLFFSGLEQITQPGYGVLADSALSLPGFEQILWQRLSPRRFFAVYRLHAAPVDSLAFTHAYLEALARYEAHYPGAADVQLFVAAQLLDLHEPAEALSRLDGLRRAGAHDPVVERLRATALVETGDDEGAAGAFLEAMRLEPPSAALWAQLGRLRMRQSRLPDALQCFQQAVDLEPATLEYLELLGRAQVVAHDLTGATGTFERCVRLAPADLIARRLAMGAWQLAGNDRRVRELYAQGVNAGLSPASLLGGEGGGPSTISATSSKASAHDRGRRQTGMNGHSGAAHSP